jgi:hypothetical protein
MRRSIAPRPKRAPGHCSWRYDARSAPRVCQSQRGTGNPNMNPDEIYAKTELGTRELAERRLGLAIDVRRLLILVDGKHTVAQILTRGRAFHASTAAFEELDQAGLVTRVFGARSAMQALSEPGGPSADDVRAFLDARKALNDAVNEHLGFRGYGLMMRLRNAENLRDLHEVLTDFAQLLVKRKGMATATPIVSAIEQMIVRKA